MGLKIALVSENASPFNVEEGTLCNEQSLYVGHIAKNLVKLGHEVDIFTRKDKDDAPDIADFEGCRVIHVPAGPPTWVEQEELLPYMKDFTAFIKNFLSWQKNPYHIFHATSWLSGLVASETKSLTGIPYVITFLGLSRTYKSYRRNFNTLFDRQFETERRIVQECDHIISGCQQEQKDLTALYHADHKKITLIPCGFDSGDFFPMNRSQACHHLGIDENQFTILQFFNLTCHSGIDTTIESLSLLQPQIPDSFRLLIATDQVIESELTDLIAKKNLENNLSFINLKHRSQLKYFYNSAHVFVALPDYENFGITSIESMACGTPVIGSNVGCLQFSIQDEVTGFLIPPKHPTILKNKLHELYLDRHKLKSFGKSALLLSHQFFHWNTITVSIAQLYQKILNSRRFYYSHQTRDSNYKFNLH